jgi:hypothetical protein
LPPPAPSVPSAGWSRCPQPAPQNSLLLCATLPILRIFTIPTRLLWYWCVVVWRFCVVRSAWAGEMLGHPGLVRV